MSTTIHQRIYLPAALRDELIKELYAVPGLPEAVDKVRGPFQSWVLAQVGRASSKVAFERAEALSEFEHALGLVGRAGAHTLDNVRLVVQYFATAPGQMPAAELARAREERLANLRGTLEAIREALAELPAGSGLASRFRAREAEVLRRLAAVACCEI